MKIKVSDMMCHHCEEKISSALNKEGIDSTIDLENKTVEVSDEDSDDTKDIIINLGYHID